MSIRFKLILLLIVVSVAPLVIGTVIERFTIQRVGNELTELSKERLGSDQRNFLVLSAGAYAATISTRATELEYAVEVLAGAARDQLRQEGPFPLTPVYSANTDFNPENPIAPGIQPRKHALDNGPNMPPTIQTLAASSFDAHSTLITTLAQQDPQQAYDDARRLAGMTELFKDITESSPIIFNAYISLRSGVHIHYPGHGRYPETYSPQERPWWTRITDELTSQDPDFPAWGPPIVDVSTGLLIISISYPIYDDDENWIGVAVIDAVMADLLASMPDTDWADETDGYIVMRPEQSAGNPQDTSVFTIASRGMSAAGLSWDTPVEQRPFKLNDQLTQATLAQAMDRFSSNVAEVFLENGNHVLLAYTPFREADGDGDIIYLLLTVPFDVVHAPADLMTQQFSTIITEQIQRNGALASIFLLIVIAIGVVMGRSIGRPVERLAEAAEQLGEGDLSAHADIHSKDEIGKLARTFNDMVPRLRDHMRLQRSIALAQDVQQHLLPHNPPSNPNYDIAGYSDYCDETGGDYFDFIETPGNSLVVALGDVTGHGIASALLMTTARALLRAATSSHTGPAQQLNAVNQHLVNDTNDGRFMTMFLLNLEPQGNLTFAAAGHDPVIIYDPQADEFSELPNDGIPLGVSEWNYTEKQHEALPQNAVAVVGTDGIWESFNEQDEQYGKERLKQVIKDAARGTADQIAHAIIDDVKQHRGTAEQLDDVTLIVLKKKDA